METIYQRPRDYDLEHEGDDEDVAFCVRLLEKWRAKRVMELASGSGRVTIPLARAAGPSGPRSSGWSGKRQCWKRPSVNALL
jgi:hypothetical protein